MHSKIFSKFIKYYGKNKKNQIGGFNILAFIAGGMEFIGIVLFYFFTLMLVMPEMVISSRYYKPLVQYLPSNIFFNMVIILFLVVSVFYFKNLIMIIYSFLQSSFLAGWKTDINNMLMKYYIYTPFSVTMKQSEQEKIYSLTTQTSQVLDNFVLHSIYMKTNLIISIMIIIPLMFKYPLETVISGFVLFFLIKKQCKLSENKGYKLEKTLEKANINNSTQLIENIKNLKEIKLFRVESHFYIIFVMFQKIFNKEFSKGMYEKLIQPHITEILKIFAVFMFCAVLTARLQDEYEIIIGLSMLAITLLRLIPIAKQIQKSYLLIKRKAKSAKKMNDEFERYDFKNLQQPTNPETDIQFKERIKLEKVNFGYEPDKPVLKNISFEIKRGEMIAIVGASESGKETLANIIMGLEQITSGSMMIDFLDITSRNYYCLKKITGYVSNKINIIKGTVKENVAFGEDETEINELEVIRALEKAKIYNKFAKTKSGIRSELIDMSQNQKQKLALARVFYKDSEIIVIEDFSRGINLKTETEIIEILKEIKGQKTLITIAPNIVTLKMCDKIIYLKSGVVLAEGTFEELKENIEEFRVLLKVSK